MQPVLVVTGGSRGIGAAVARLAGARGYAVCVHCRDRIDAAEEVASAVRAGGAKAIAVHADVGDSEAVGRLFARVDNELGAVTALVNNAGIVGGKSRVDEIDPDRLVSVFATNVYGSFYASREAIRRMSTARGGSGGAIVNISSMASVLGGLERTVHYAASKGAVDAMTGGLAREVAREGIRINTIRPGIVHTDIHAPKGGDAFIASVTASGVIPIGRVGQPSEIAEAALWLLSDAAAYVTGAILNVSGGR